MLQGIAPFEASVRLRNALARIETQSALVATLKPGSDGHRIATDVLLTFQDTLHALAEAHELLERLVGPDLTHTGR